MDYLSNMFSLKGNVALITGGSYGIGFAIAKALTRAGAVIAFNCRSQEHLDQAMKDYEKKALKLTAIFAMSLMSSTCKNWSVK